MSKRMVGYTKLFNEILMSTIWREPDHVRLLWITMLALKDRWHVVNASMPALADTARISIDDCQDALKVLSSPDPHSRSKDHEGRRIKEVEGGWAILNGEKYRNKMSLDERREYQRIKQREYRKQRKVSPTCQQSGQQFTHTEADTDPDTKKGSPPTPQISEVINIYHSTLCPPLPKVVKRTKAREAHIRQRWNEHPSLDAFRNFFLHVEASDFLMGRTNGRDNRPFRCNLDWLMKPDNFAKVIEGNYAND